MRKIATARAAPPALAAVLLAIVLLAAGSGPAAGQAGHPTPPDPAADDRPPEVEPRSGVSVRMGFASAKGDLGDFVDDGYVVGLAVGRRVSRRVTLLVEGTVEDYERGGRLEPGPPLSGVLGPNIELWRVTGLASVELTDPPSRWEVAVQAGAGATVVSADAFANAPAFETVEPTLMAGVRTGYELGRHVTAFVRGGGSIWFDEPGGEGYLAKEVTFTHSAGLRFRF